MKFVAVADQDVQEVAQPGLRVRVPRPITAGDTCCIVLNSSSSDLDGEPRAELRIYRLEPDPAKSPPRYRLAETMPPDAHLAFELRPSTLVLYTTDPPVTFMRLRHLLAAEEVDALEVFAEFDRQIARLAKAGRLACADEDATCLYERAAKCRARCLATPYEAEADSSFQQATRLLGKVIGLAL